MSDSKFNLPREAATGLFAVCIFGALYLHTVPALLAGLLAFVLTRGLLQALHRFDVERKLLAHELLAGIIVGVGSLAVLTGISVLVARFLGGESVRDFMLTLAETITQAKQYLPGAISDYIPTTLLDMRALAANALKEHANEVAGFGSHVLHSMVLTLIGWITGVLAAVSMVASPTDVAPPAFFATWSRLWAQLSASFKHVAWAQAKIAGINALLTGLFVMVVMPMLGWKLPYAKTLILATFFCGLLPVVGNLLSNAFICILALSVSFPAAIVAGVFLIVVHKLEYFLNARIQGQEIGAKAWELLIVLFVFELLFGPAGMVAAPVIYAFVKADLKRMRWLA
jgi:predicted PurR-regulated permease PerM